MNILPPHEFGPISISKDDTQDDLIDKIHQLSSQIQILLDWQRDVYRFLMYPTFSKLRFYPRADVSSPSEGDIFYDSDDNTFKGYDSTAWRSFH